MVIIHHLSCDGRIDEESKNFSSISKNFSSTSKKNIRRRIKISSSKKKILRFFAIEENYSVSNKKQSSSNEIQRIFFIDCRTVRYRRIEESKNFWFLSKIFYSMIEEFFIFIELNFFVERILFFDNRRFFFFVEEIFISVE